ncbi:MAG: prepilin-type N-terminal cleavage/methylation domain-containing protein [Pseudomonadota bacterium]
MRAALSRGFTLLELLIVVAIMAIATAGVSFALRDSAVSQLERDADRLAALLESARAQSRTLGVPVRWRAVEGGFRFEGLPPKTLPDHWLSDTTSAVPSAPLVLGPEAVIGPQSVVLVSQAAPGRSLRVATDGLRPFAVGGETP